MIRIATVVQITPRVLARWSGSDVPLRSSDTLSALAVGDRVLVAEADNGGFYAIERIGV